MELFFNNTSDLLPPSEPTPEVNSTYVTITGLVVFGFPVMTMTIFCILRIKLERKKRYRGFYLDDRIDGAAAQCPMIPNIEDEQYGTSSSSDLERAHTSRRFLTMILNFIRMDQSTSTEEVDLKISSLDCQV
ncbi:uncharacterized protein [Mytilus edulis]|uniref:uncharacterized protein n=1 Tax=Mytilus edulis TaxID=6550 RepID=UPI0039F07CC7